MSGYDELRKRVSDCLDDAGEFGGALLEDFEAAHAHELAQKQRDYAGEMWGLDGLWANVATMVADLIDPEVE